MDSEFIEVRTGSPETVVDLTREIGGSCARRAPREGLLHVWVPHATAGLAVIETGAGSDTDLLAALRELLPADDRWGTATAARPRPRPRPAGDRRAVDVDPGDRRPPALGTWQSICLVDTNGDNPTRSVRLSLLTDAS